MKNKALLALFLVLAAGVTVWAVDQAQSSKTAIDPVCGMSVVKDGAKWTFDYKGTTYYFCSEGCKTSFSKEPEKYLAKTAEKTEQMGMGGGRGMGQGMMGGQMQSQMQGQMKGQMPGQMSHMQGQMMQGHAGMAEGQMLHHQGLMPGMMGGQMHRPMGMRMKMRPGRMGMMGRRPGMMGEMAGFGPMMMEGFDKKVENTKDGVVVTLSSKDPETVKMIQEHLAQMLEREKMMKEHQARMNEARTAKK